MAYREKSDQKACKTRVYYRNRDYIRSRKELGGGCCVCGESRLPCLDYHHKDPKDKKYNIGEIPYYSLEVIDKEINKCMLICANCHRILHAKEELQKAKEKNEFLPLFNILT